MIPFAENKQDALQAMLYELQNQKLEIVLVDAPKPKHIGHKIRIVQTENPEWYRYYYANFPNVRRDRTLIRLEKMIDQKIDKSSDHDSALIYISEMLVLSAEDESEGFLDSPF